MPVVVIDAERLRNLHCGLGQFCLHLSRALLESAGPEIELVPLVRCPGQDYFVDGTRFLTPASWQREPVASLLRPCVTAFRGYRGIDVWHATHQDSKYLPLNSSIPLVLTIHDLNFLREKSAGTARRRLRRLQVKVNRASVITTASQHAADEIQEHLKLGHRKIEVIAHGVCVNPGETGNRRPVFVPPGRFLFAIGDITAKKNFHVLVDLAKELPEYRIVVAGKKSSDYAAMVERRAVELGVADRIVLPGVVSEEERLWLYENCEAFVFPSLSEGFGLPVIEAMACGRPVFTSTLTSLPEVGGELAFYWSVFDGPEMARVFRVGMRRAAADPTFTDRMKQHAAKFSWGSAAGQYLALYKRISGEADRRAA